MSGMSNHFPEFAYAGEAIQQKDIDQYIQYEVRAPSVSATYIGTKSPVAAGTPSAIVFISKIPDYPRNLLYQITGVSAGMGGTFTAVGVDQFGSVIKETIGFATAASGGSVVGTAIFGSVSAATVTATGLGGTAIGTSSIGFSTTAGTGGNWFGLPVKVGAATDLRTINWITTSTSTPINGGTNFGSLCNVGGLLPPHSFQGTSGVAITDTYVVTIKTTFDNLQKGVMTGL